MKPVLILLAAAASFAGCSKESTTTGSTSSSSIDCTGNSASFAADVLPLFQSSCSYNSSCHGSGSSEGPGALLTYAQIYNNRNSIRSSVVSGSMPRNSSLGTAQKAVIVCWIDNGSQNN